VALNHYAVDSNREYHPGWVSLEEHARAAGVPLHRFDPQSAEWRFAEGTYQWWAIYRNLDRISTTYDYYCLADDDVLVSTAQLNSLFLLGEAKGLQLYQPALTHDSYCAHPQLLRANAGGVRPSRFVEGMIPFFSRWALQVCRPTFLESRSGWGLDHAWGKLLDYRGMAIIDAIAVRHVRPYQSSQMQFLDGPATPYDEMAALLAKYGSDLPW